VPLSENTRVLEKRYKALSGLIEVLIKEGIGHHPHSLIVPTQIVNFIITNTTGLDQYFKLRGQKLKNSWIRFEKDRQGSVVFLGGSITHMSGWRDQVCDYLRKRFPETQFEFINAGISSTGSTAGAFRLVRDVFCNGPVDLLFEEAAVNDSTNERSDVEQCRGMEGILRHARSINPNLDIVTMYFVDPGKISQYNAGQTPPVIGNHDRVSAYYQVSSINLAMEVTDRINAGQFTWEGDFKDLHPSPFGQKLYAATIIRMLEQAWHGQLNQSEAVAAYPIPEKMLDPFSYVYGRLGDIRLAELRSGWRIETTWHPKDQILTRPGFVDIPMLVADKPGDEFSLMFMGTAIGLFIVVGPDAGMLEFSVDRGPFKQIDSFTRWSRNIYLPWCLMLETELSNDHHELVVRVLAEKNVNSCGTACRIAHFLLNDRQ
jgi:hypothetical protein